ncbi:TPA: 30S ribosomal protein S8 [Patescibacteria group bacterium]|nr:MAG: 30S ribosomal protein S8 [Parcubacteria group bacterium GW2011_GWA2_46_39]HBV33386.1 30S ribosomal protein S8 [Patescibacteria group bacterium]HCU47811.1 30S ribosomal protein S8 [Patescibacteria group bacterium]
MTDPISDMLTRIRNGLAVGKTEVAVPYSNLKERMAKILVQEGYLDAVEEVTSPYRSLMLRLKYQEGQPAIRHLARVSKPGNRLYVNKDQLPKVLSGLGVAIISTSQGVMTNKEARQKKLGGEVICELY